MLFTLALFVAVATAATPSFRIVQSYGTADCSGDARATFAVQDTLTQGCTATNCSGTGFIVSCAANAPATVAPGADCGFDAFEAANCDTVTRANRVRFTVGQCHNIDAAGAGNLAGFFCGGATNFKSIRPAGCAGRGTMPGFPTGITCYSDVNCATAITTTTQSTAVPTTGNTTVTTPAPTLCRTCAAPAASTYSLVFSAKASFSYCGASIMQVSVAVLALVSVFVAAF